MLKQNEEKQKIDNFVDELSDDDLDDLVREFRRKK
jgi:ribosomal protein L12E/L44/L45/RPP1/RPP2